jgi:hypothetical protein
MRLGLFKKDILQAVPGLVPELEQMVERINIWSDAEHDPQTGQHGAISVLGLTWEGETQTTVGAAGGASALPATPRGYLEIMVDGVACVVPFYAKV